MWGSSLLSVENLQISKHLQLRETPCHLQSPHWIVSRNISMMHMLSTGSSMIKGLMGIQRFLFIRMGRLTRCSIQILLEISCTTRCGWHKAFNLSKVVVWWSWSMFVTPKQCKTSAVLNPIITIMSNFSKFPLSNGLVPSPHCPDITYIHIRKSSSQPIERAQMRRAIRTDQSDVDTPGQQVATSIAACLVDHFPIPLLLVFQLLYDSSTHPVDSMHDRRPRGSTHYYEPFSCAQERYS